MESIFSNNKVYCNIVKNLIKYTDQSEKGDTSKDVYSFS